MNILGVVFNPGGFPTVPDIGGADNYFPQPNESGDGWGQPNDREVVWGGTVKACPNWIFGDSTKSCDVRTGDPNTPTSTGRRFIARSIRVTQAETNGNLFLSKWNGTRNGEIRMKLSVKTNREQDFVFGPNGVDLGEMPFIRLTSIAKVEITYDIE